MLQAAQQFRFDHCYWSCDGYRVADDNTRVPQGTEGGEGAEGAEGGESAAGAAGAAGASRYASQETIWSDFGPVVRKPAALGSRACSARQQRLQPHVPRGCSPTCQGLQPYACVMHVGARQRTQWVRCDGDGVWSDGRRQDLLGKTYSVLYLAVTTPRKPSTHSTHSTHSTLTLLALLTMGRCWASLLPALTHYGQVLGQPPELGLVPRAVHALFHLKGREIEISQGEQADLVRYEIEIAMLEIYREEVYHLLLTTYYLLLTTYYLLLTTTTTYCSLLTAFCLLLST